MTGVMNLTCMLVREQFHGYNTSYLGFRNLLNHLKSAKVPRWCPYVSLRVYRHIWKTWRMYTAQRLPLLRVTQLSSGHVFISELRT